MQHNLSFWHGFVWPTDICFRSSVMLLSSEMTMPAVHKPSCKGNTQLMPDVLWIQVWPCICRYCTKDRQVSPASQLLLKSAVADGSCLRQDGHRLELPKKLSLPLCDWKQDLRRAAPAACFGCLSDGQKPPLCLASMLLSSTSKGERWPGQCYDT